MTQIPCSYRQEGNLIDHTPVGAIAAGEVVLVGTLVAIAPIAIAAGAKGSIAVRGVFNVPKDNSNVTADDKLYWDANGDPYGGTAGTGCFTKTQQGIDGVANKPAGRATEDAGTTTGDVDMRLMSAFGT